MVVEGLWADLIVVGGGFDAQCAVYTALCFSILGLMHKVISMVSYVP